MMMVTYLMKCLLKENIVRNVVEYFLLKLEGTVLSHDGCWISN